MVTILGIDPGVADTGFGVIQVVKGEFNVKDYGSIKTSPKRSLEFRLKIIFDELENIIKKYQPQILAVEEIFFNKNVTTAIAVSQARGTILLAGAQNNLSIAEYTPLQVKQAVTSYGRASKQQMQQMVKTILKLKTIPRPDDAADALAVAICCANSRPKNYGQKN